MARKIIKETEKTVSVDDVGKVDDQNVFRKKGEAVVDGETYDVEHLATEGVQIIDPGVGTPTILRRFYFKATDDLLKNKPSKQEIVSNFKQLIEVNLWGDGLIIREDKPIELISKTKAKKVSQVMYREMHHSGADFALLCLATPRKGQSVLDTPFKAQ